ncbi:MAG: pyridoxal phosphate-dependent aminotransferase [Desulfobacteraceae bacterium]|nr:MAG: pyridoxal phosphate-dependent aminotransferase [Desulfobacteraceae bacterium]
MTIAGKIETFISRSSWIRKMFEEGTRLKQQHGSDNVFDFSLGNPYLQPPDKFRTVLQDLLRNAGPCDHSYMPNTGYPAVCKKVADYLVTEQGVPISGSEIIMTCGAAGGLNVILKTLLNPNEEVVTPAPYFVEYGFYADNHGGKLVTVPTNSDFTLDLQKIESAITGKTRMVLINSPNNPTGQIYSKKSLEQLGSMLRQKSKELNRTIYLVSDEPYRKIVYDGIDVPSLFPCYDDSIIVTSFSKDISIPGERIGFVAVNPKAEYKKDLIAGMALANRILGFVNAPALMQRAVGELQGESADMRLYAKKRNLLCDSLSDFGYQFEKPAGAFYLFCKSPIPDDVRFVKILQEELILTVPGSGFGGPGYFRIAFCVDDDTIIKALPGFKRAIQKV